MGSKPLEDAEGFRPAELVLKRDKGGLAEYTSDKEQRRNSRRKSQNRRVSFAPDAQLETMHLYPQEKTPDQNFNPNVKERFSSAAFQLKSWQPVPSPMLTGSTVQDSPRDSTMDLTGGTANVQEATASLDANISGHMRPVGEITAGVPTLAELAQSDTETEQLNQKPHQRTAPPASRPESLKVADAVPSLGAVIEEEEGGSQPVSQHTRNLAELTAAAAPLDGPTIDLTGDANAAADSNEANQKAAQGASAPLRQEGGEDGGSNQIHKWGWAPGEDDTRDLNVDNIGRMVMGETTYNYIHGAADVPGESNQQTQPQAQQHSRSLGPADLDSLFRRADEASDVLRSAIKENLDSPGSARRMRSGTGFGSARSLASRPEEAYGSESTPRRYGNRSSEAFQEAWAPAGRLSEAFSDRSIMAQRAGPSAPASSPGISFGTPQGVTPTSRFGTEPLPGSYGPIVPRGSSLRPSGLHTGDLLSGDPYPVDRSPATLNQEQMASATPSEPLQFPPRATPGAPAEQPLIDLGTPQAKRPAAHSAGRSELRASSHTQTPGSDKKRRMSIVSALNDLTEKLLQDDSADLLLESHQDEAHPQLEVAPQSVTGPTRTGKDATSLLLEETVVQGLPSFLQGKQNLEGAHGLRDLAIASSTTPGRSSPVAAQRLNLPPDIRNPKRFLPGKGSTTKDSPLHAVPGNAQPPPPATAGPVPVTPAPGALAAGMDDFTMGLDFGTSPMLLQDERTDSLEGPPEPTPRLELRYQAPPAPAFAPTPSIFPGGALLQRTPPASARGSQALQRPIFASPEPLTTHSQAGVSAGVEGGGASPEPGTSSPDNVIPGAVKLARTPTRAPSRFPPAQPPVSTVRQGNSTTPNLPPHPSPVPASTGVMTRSATKAAYTPSPTRTRHRLGRTPMQPKRQPEPLSLHEFLREVDIQFLDHMRRGASLNLADLASDPPPSSLQDCHKLMCLTAPEVAQYEEGIQTLQNETDARKALTKEKEEELLQQNLPISLQIQTASPEDHEAIKCGAQTLKRLCRMRTTVAWKEWRATMEARKGSSLQSKLQLLQHDRSFLHSNLKYLTELGTRVAQYGQDSRTAAMQAAKALAAEVARRQALLSLRSNLVEQKAANEERAMRKKAAEEKLSSLKDKHAVLGSERAQLQARLTQLHADVEASQQAMAARADRSVSAEALLTKIDELDILTGIQGWCYESGTSTPSGMELSLRFGPFFRLRISFNKPEGGGAPTAQGYLGLTSPEESQAVPSTYRTLAAHLASNAAFASTSSILDKFALPRSSTAALSAIIQGYSTTLGRITDLVKELGGLRLAFPALSEVAPEEGGTLRLTFLDLESTTKISVDLTVGLGPGTSSWSCVPRVHFPGAGDISAEAISSTVASVGPGYGRMRAICSALSALVAGSHPAQHYQAASQPAQDSAYGSQQAEGNDTAAPSAAAPTNPQEQSTAGPTSNEQISKSAAIEGQPASDLTQTTTQAGDNQTSNIHVPPTESTAQADQDEASLHVFSNPLFNSATPARPAG